MPTVSLISTGQKLGRVTSDEVRLGSLRTNGYTRTFAVSGYLRVNPFEVENGTAGDPAEAGSLHRLGDWVGYDHSNLNGGSQLAVTSSYGEVTLTWSLPSGYSRAPAILNQKIFVKDTGQTVVNETALSTDPLTLPDQTQLAGDGTTDDVDLGAYGDNYVAISLVATFDDSVTVHEGDSTDTYSAAAGQDALTGASLGILARAFAEAPTIDNVTQTPLPGDCFVGNDVTILVNVDMEGPSQGTLQERVNGGTWTTVDSGVAAGTTGNLTLTNRASGNTYDYRLRYNDVSPTQWSNVLGIFADCTQV